MPTTLSLSTARSDLLTNLNRREWLSIGAAAASGLLPSAAASKPGHDPIRLSLNENPFGPSPLALHAIRAQLTDLSSYAGDEVAELTKTIAAREGIAPEQIVLGEILDVLGLYLSARGGPGGEFIYSEPGYTALVNAVAPTGGVVVGVPLNKQLENDLPAIAGAVNARTRAIYLINPHNPSGTVSEASQFIDFVRELSKRALVIVDEAYLEFTPDFEKRLLRVSSAAARRAEQKIDATMREPRQSDLRRYRGRSGRKNPGLAPRPSLPAKMPNAHPDQH
jgi:histidinol-phosphate aminotransferase